MHFKEVLELTGDTHNSTIKENDFVMIKYYSPSCGHCVRFAPEYDKLAKQMKDEKKPFIIAAVDMVAHEAVGEWADVQGYPTLRFFARGHRLDYDGARET